jgi:Arc/MetJ-type ribon-helix-helix transcriptional regulator
MARTQTLVQLTDELLEQLDTRAAREGRNRSELIREALAEFLAADREAEIDRLIVESYTRQPEEDLLGWGAAAAAMIAAEPWEPSRRPSPSKAVDAPGDENDR